MATIAPLSRCRQAQEAARKGPANWNDQIAEHLTAHGIASDEFEQVVCDPDEVAESRSFDRPIVFGETLTGRYLACVYELLDDTTVLSVTAHEVED